MTTIEQIAMNCIKVEASYKELMPDGLIFLHADGNRYKIKVSLVVDRVKSISRKKAVSILNLKT